MIGLMWFDNDPDRTIEEKIRTAAAFYLAKSGVSPDRCFVNADQLGDETVAIDGVEIDGVRWIMKNNFYVGKEKESENGRDKS